MINLAVVCVVLLILPFLLGYIHTGINKKTKPVLIYYRYFMSFNMLLAALFVAARMILIGPQAAQISGWVYSPVFHLYGIAILSMAVMAAVSLYQNNRIILAPLICWLTFLVLSTFSHVYEITRHNIADINIMYVHIAYYFITSVIMLRFLYLLKKNFKERGTVSDGTTQTN